LLTCIVPPLLSPQGIEGDVLEASHLRLQKTQVHERGATVVLTFGVLHPRTRDPEDGDAPAVHPTHLDSLKLTAADEPQGPEKEIVGLQHWTLPWTAGGEVGYVSLWIEGEPVSPLISGRPSVCPPRPGRRRPAYLKTAFTRKPVKRFLCVPIV
jgi:hypothetical protein